MSSSLLRCPEHGCHCMCMCMATALSLHRAASPADFSYFDTEVLADEELICQSSRTFTDGGISEGIEVEVEVEFDDDSRLSVTEEETEEDATNKKNSCDAGKSDARIDVKKVLELVKADQNQRKTVQDEGFAGMTRGFLNGRTNRSRSTAENRNDENQNANAVPVPENRSILKTSKQEGSPPPVEITPEPVLVDRQPIVPKAVELPPKVKCSMCRLDIQPRRETYFKLTCSAKCTLCLHKGCFSNAMALQNLKKKKDQKGAVCVTDGCGFPLLRIEEADMENNLDVYLYCTEKPNTAPVVPTKEKKKERKKENNKKEKGTFREDRERKTSVVQEDDFEDNEIAEESISTPALPPSRKAQPLTVDQAVFARPLERKDPFAEKYGLVEDKKEEEKKGGRKNKEKDVINLVDEHITKGKTGRGVTYKSDDEYDSIDSEPPFPDQPSSFAPGSHLFESPEPNSYLPLPTTDYPKINDDSGLDWLVEQVLTLKDDVLANCKESGTVESLRTCFLLVCLTNDVLRNSINQIFAPSELEKKDGGLAKKFVSKLGWFKVSRIEGKVSYKKKEAGLPIGRGPLLSEASYGNNLGREDDEQEHADLEAFLKEQMAEMQAKEEREKREARELAMRGRNDEEEDAILDAVQQIMEQSAARNNLSSNSHGGRRASPSNIEFIHSPPKTQRNHTMQNNSRYGSLPGSGFGVRSQEFPPGIPYPQAQALGGAYPQQSANSDEIARLEARMKMEQKSALQKMTDEIERLMEDNKTLKQQNHESRRREGDAKFEVESMKDTLVMQEQRFANERALLEQRAAEGDSSIHYEREEYNRIKWEQMQEKEKRVCEGRKSQATSAIYHINQILHVFQGQLTSAEIEESRKVDVQCQVTDLLKTKDEWQSVYDASCARLYEIENNVAGSATALPPVPRLPESCCDLYLQSVRVTSQAPEERANQVLGQVTQLVTEQCHRHKKPVPGESTVRKYIVKFDVLDSVLGQTRSIDVEKCAAYMCKELLLPMGLSSRPGEPAWQAEQAAAPSTHPRHSAPVSKPLLTYRRPASAGREIDWASHECKICLQPFARNQRLSAKQCSDCHEPFHPNCITSWLRQEVTGVNRCPNCNILWPDEDEFPGLR